MKRSYGYLAGASAVAIVAFAAVQMRPDPPSTDAPAVVAASPVFVADAAPMPQPAAGMTAAPTVEATAGPTVAPPVATAEIVARIDDLTGRLAQREADVAAMTASLAERDASLDTLTATLTEREAEIQALRDELVTLRERYAFDIELEAMKGRGAASAEASIETEGAPAAAALLVSAEATDSQPDAPGIVALTQIHFESGSSSLTPGGQVHAAAAAVMLTEMGVVRVRLVGHSDRVGRADRNRALATARAQAVADFLVHSGVAATLLETAGMGEDDLPVATGDGVSEPLNRTVAIVAVPRPTS